MSETPYEYDRTASRLYNEARRNFRACCSFGPAANEADRAVEDGPLPERRDPEGTSADLGPGADLDRPHSPSDRA